MIEFKFIILYTEHRGLLKNKKTGYQHVGACFTSIVWINVSSPPVAICLLLMIGQIWLKRSLWMRDVRRRRREIVSVEIRFEIFSKTEFSSPLECPRFTSWRWNSLQNDNHREETNRWDKTIFYTPRTELRFIRAERQESNKRLPKNALSAERLTREENSVSTQIYSIFSKKWL